MFATKCLTVALGAVSLASGPMAFIPPVGTLTRVVDFRPERCVITGPNTGNWSVYPNFNIIKRCQQTMFYDFSLYDPVDDPNTNHRIQACSSFGPDFDNMPSKAVAANVAESASVVDVEFELGWWHEDFGLAKAAIRSLVEQIGSISTTATELRIGPSLCTASLGKPPLVFTSAKGLLNQGLSTSALSAFQNNFDTLNVATPSLAM